MLISSRLLHLTIHRCNYESGYRRNGVAEKTMPKRLVAGLLVLTLASACDFTPHEVNITAEAPKTPSTIGAGITLHLQVIDDRDSTVVGQRGWGMQGANITAGRVMQVLENELANAFAAKGFRFAPSGSPVDAEIEVRLRAFKFFLETGFFSNAQHINVVVAVEAEKRGQDYDRTYRASSEDPGLFTPLGETLDAKLNSALSIVLGRIAGDTKLLVFLAR